MPIGTIVTAVISTIATKITTQSAEKAFEHRSAILGKVRGILIGEELITLQLLEKYPDNPDMQKEVAEKLTPRLEANPAVVEELKALLAQMPGLEIARNDLNQIGDHNQAAQDIHGSTINFNR